MNGKTNSEKLDKIRADVIEMKMAIIGSEQLKVDGLVQKVDHNTKYIEADKKFKYGVVGAIAVITFIGGFLKIFWERLFG